MRAPNERPPNERPPGEMTEAERGLVARAMYAKLTEADPGDWRVVRRQDVERGRWYDFLDAETGLYGQCMLREDQTDEENGGGWHQAPRGASPTILQYLKKRGAR